MPATIETFTNLRLQPKSFPGQERRRSGSFGINQTLARGTVVAKKTSDGLIYAYAARTSVQTVVVTTAMSAGQMIVTAKKADGSIVSAAFAYNASTATIQTAMNALLGANAVAITGTGAASFTATFSGAGYAGIPQPKLSVDISNATGATAVAVAETSTVDGTEVAIGFLEFDIKTDASGNIFLGTEAAVANVRLTPLRETSYFIAGTFDTTDLTGYDANAAAQLSVRALGNNLINLAF